MFSPSLSSKSNSTGGNLIGVQIDELLISINDGIINKKKAVLISLEVIVVVCVIFFIFSAFYKARAASKLVDMDFASALTQMMCNMI